MLRKGILVAISWVAILIVTILIHRGYQRRNDARRRAVEQEQRAAVAKHRLQPTDPAAHEMDEKLHEQVDSAISQRVESLRSCGTLALKDSGNQRVTFFVSFSVNPAPVSGGESARLEALDVLEPSVPFSKATVQCLRDRLSGMMLAHVPEASIGWKIRHPMCFSVLQVPPKQKAHTSRADHS